MTFLIILGYAVIVALFAVSAYLFVCYTRYWYYGIGYTNWPVPFWGSAMAVTGYFCYKLAPFSVIFQVPA